MKIGSILIVLSLASSILIGCAPIVHSAIDPADYHWTFWVGGLRIWVQYPEECHTGDSISYNILIYSSMYSAGNYVDEIKVTISVFVSQTEGATLYDAWIYQDILMPQGNEYTKKITVVVPNKAWWYVTIVFDVSTYSGDMAEHASSNLGLSSTIVRSKTYAELQSENYDLWHNYTNLESEYENYKHTHNYSNPEYNSLNSSYNSLESSYNSLQSDYDELKSKYQAVGEPVFIRNLMYLFLITTIVFIITTVYFAVRKPKVKPA